MVPQNTSNSLCCSYALRLQVKEQRELCLGKIQFSGQCRESDQRIYHRKWQTAYRVTKLNPGQEKEWLNGCQTITCLHNESHILKNAPFSSLSNRFPNIDLTYKVSQIIVLITCLQIENFFLSSLILILPISFSYLYVLPEISSTMDRNNSWYLRCISDFKGKDSKVVSMMFTVHIS